MNSPAVNGGAARPRNSRAAFARVFHFKPRSAAPIVAAADPLANFSKEQSVAAPKLFRPTEQRGGRGPSPASLIGLGVAIAVALTLLSIAADRLRRVAAPPAPQTGTVTVDTVPSGVKIAIDGQPQGLTPVALSLAPGSHVMTLINDRDQRTIPLTVVAGRQSSEHFEFAARPLTPPVGLLSVTADVPSRVSVDGRPLGSAPVVVRDIAPGDHLVSVTSGAGTVTRKVSVSAGATASAAFTFAASPATGPAAGWMSFSAPFELQVFEGKDLIGGNGAKVTVVAGRHDVRLVNEALGYTESRRVEVTAGKVTTVRIEPPRTTLNINARPWADVSIDGTDVGETPLANISIPVGTHVVVFHHPQLGEQRRTITATEKGPNRVSADLTTK